MVSELLLHVVPQVTTKRTVNMSFSSECICDMFFNFYLFHYVMTRFFVPVPSTFQSETLQMLEWGQGLWLLCSNSFTHTLSPSLLMQARGPEELVGQQ